jgi:hypothetical protein
MPHLLCGVPVVLEEMTMVLVVVALADLLQVHWL